MARERPYIFAMNGGEVSALALPRVDLQRMKITCSLQENFLPRVIGPMSLRPGTGFKLSTKNDAVAKMVPFIFSAEDTAIIELTDSLMRVVVDGAPISRTAVSTVVTNGDFNAATGWSITTSGASSASISGGLLTMSAQPVGSSVIVKRSDSVSGGDQGVEHAIEITVDSHECQFRVGSTDGGQEYIKELTLREGFHTLAFTPTGGTYYIQFELEGAEPCVVSDVSIAASGEVSIAAPWAAADLNSLRFAQSGDVIFVVSSKGTYQPRRIVRAFGEDSQTSWSLEKYFFRDGPFLGKTADLTLQPSSKYGSGTLTASQSFFDSGHVGACFRLTHSSTKVEQTISGADKWSDWVEVTGVRATAWTGAVSTTDARRVSFTTTDNATLGAWAGAGAEIHMQTSLDLETGLWTSEENPLGNFTADRFPGESGTTYVRIGFSHDSYVTGGIDVTMTYDGGGGDGYIVITGVNSPTEAEYITTGPEDRPRLHQGGASPEGTTEDWAEGVFSTRRGWPTAVGLFEGRLWFGSKDKVYGSVSDDFTSFDVSVDGDSGPIIRSVATGPVNKVVWILGLQRLCCGTSGAEPVGRSSSFDEVITPTNFSIKDASTQGSADIQALKIDKSGAFVQRGGKKFFDLFYSVESQDYTSSDLTRYHPDLLQAGVKVMAVQRQPDTRIWLVLNDGTAAVLTYEKSEDVLAWYRVTTDGTFEDVITLPNTTDDDVHFVINRTINGVTKRYLETLAYEENAQGGTANYMADSYVVVNVDNSATVTGLGHLEAKNVVVWAAGEAVMDGRSPKTFTVSGGEITLDSAVTGDVIVGLAYRGRWRSSKLAYGVADQSPMSRKKQIMDLAPLLYKTHSSGLKYGYSFDQMDYLPLTYKMEVQGANVVRDSYDQEAQALPGNWDTDSRLCLEGNAPLPCTVQALSMTVEGH